MNQKERVFWSDLMARIEPDAAMYAATEARLRAEADAPLDEAWVRARLAGIVAAETQTQTRRRRRRLGAVAVLMVLALPALALGTRALLWQSTGTALETMTYADATGIMWNEAEPRHGFAIGVLTARLVTAIDAFRAVKSGADTSVAARGAEHLATLLSALDGKAEPTTMLMDDDWAAIATAASDPNIDASKRLQELDRLAVLALGALKVLQIELSGPQDSDAEPARLAMLRHLRKRVTGEDVRTGR